MVDSTMAHDPRDHGATHESHVKTYLRVFVALAVFTAVEYFYARIFKDSFGLLVLGLVVIAVVKAGLVGLYFMHLKFEGRWVYYLLVPAGILAVVLVLALYPDIAMQSGTGDDVEAVSAAPAEAGPAPLLTAAR